VPEIRHVRIRLPVLEVVMPEITRILCPVDFSDASEHAIEHAVMIAGWYRARITGLHVYTPMWLPVAATELGGIPTALNLESTLEKLRNETAAAFTRARAAGIEVEALVEVGTPTPCIVQTAAQQRASLVVIGTHGASGFEHLVLGSVTEKVLRKAPCPVLTVPPRAQVTSTLPFKRVLCAIDFSESSIAALEYAFSLAQEGDADLTLLHVFEWPTESEAPYTGTFDMARYRRDVEQQATEQLSKLVPDSVRTWCTPHTRFGHGKAYREILSVGAQESADIIVMGVHGRNVIDRMLFGSTTHQVIRHATCPVLTLRR
jgi:nucleotide-binding universal stress UspA family protein